VLKKMGAHRSDILGFLPEQAGTAEMGRFRTHFKECKPTASAIICGAGGIFDLTQQPGRLKPLR
jgi:hypothetical protein